jgi:hypothetical protein
MIIQVLLTLGLALLKPYAYPQGTTSHFIRSSSTTIGVVGLYFVWLPDQR